MKLIKLLLIGAAIYYVVKNPTGAGDTLRAAGNTALVILSNVGQAAAAFVDALVNR